MLLCSHKIPKQINCMKLLQNMSTALLLTNSRKHIQELFCCCEFNVDSEGDSFNIIEYILYSIFNYAIETVKNQLIYNRRC